MSEWGPDANCGTGFAAAPSVESKKSGSRRSHRRVRIGSAADRAGYDPVAFVLSRINLLFSIAYFAKRIAPEGVQRAAFPVSFLPLRP